MQKGVWRTGSLLQCWGSRSRYRPDGEQSGGSSARKLQLPPVLSHTVAANSATPQTGARQAPLSMGFPSKNTGVGCHFLLQVIFLTQGLNLDPLHWQVNSLPLSHLGSWK